MGFRDFFSALPLIGQVDSYHFYIPGYTEALKQFSEVRVVLSEEWLSGVPYDLLDYFYQTRFPCYFVPVFGGDSCFGFVLKGFGKATPRFCTNGLLPGCERVKGGELVVLVEGFKDSYIPMMVSKGLPVVVIPMLTAVPSRDLLGFLKEYKCPVVYVPDSDEHKRDHLARFYELCGKVGVVGTVFEMNGIKDFGDFFNPVFRSVALGEGKRLREVLRSLTTF